MFPGARVFAVGFSNGGRMVIRLVHERGDLLAGAAVVAATLPAADNFVDSGARPSSVPMVLVHGTADPLVPHDPTVHAGTHVARLTYAGADPVTLFTVTAAGTPSPDRRRRR